MLTLINKAKSAICAKSVDFVGNTLCVFLNNGNEITVSLEDVTWLRWLLQATPEQRAHWSLEPGGFAIYWDDLDDGIEVAHLLDMPTLPTSFDSASTVHLPQYADA